MKKEWANPVLEHEPISQTQSAVYGLGPDATTGNEPLPS
jgi:hypothetical protein